jgi:hypothetical protein
MSVPWAFVFLMMRMGRATGLENAPLQVGPRV